MRLVTWKRIEQWSAKYSAARPWLAAWAASVQQAGWAHQYHVRKSYPHAHEMIVGSGRPVTVFNVKGYRYRMITAIHHNTRTVFAMRFMTHAEYDKGAWKEIL